MSDTRSLYLDLVQKCLLGLIYEDPPKAPDCPPVFSAHSREHGLDWPSQAHSMIGTKRMTNLRELCERVLVENVPGDFIETGVWRGGACIMMRAVLKAYGVEDRNVWVADSFEGLPPPSPEAFPADAGQNYHTFPELSVSLEDVKRNFEKYGLLDDQVKFLKGWFKDTLPIAPIERLAVLRLDGDLYESTIQSLTSLYPKLSHGGFIIIDDYGWVPPSKQAVHDFRDAHAIDAPIHDIDGIGVWWRKP